VWCSVVRVLQCGAECLMIDSFRSVNITKATNNAMVNVCVGERERQYVNVTKETDLSSDVQVTNIQTDRHIDTQTHTHTHHVPAHIHTMCQHTLTCACVHTHTHTHTHTFCIHMQPTGDDKRYTFQNRCIFQNRYALPGRALQHTAPHCNTMQCTDKHCNTLQHCATHCNTLQHTATHCNTLQHNATYWKILQDNATH